MPYRDPNDQNAASQRYYRANKERAKQRATAWRFANPEKARSADYKHRYGVTAEEVEALFEAQGGLCRICDKPLQKKGRGPLSMHVDHCHITSRVRGILCAHCNRGLGLFEDDVERMSRAIQYLETETPVELAP